MSYKAQFEAAEKAVLAEAAKTAAAQRRRAEEVFGLVHAHFVTHMAEIVTKNMINMPLSKMGVEDYEEFSRLQPHFMRIIDDEYGPVWMPRLFVGEVRFERFPNVEQRNKALHYHCPDFFDR